MKLVVVTKTWKERKFEAEPEGEEQKHKERLQEKDDRIRALEAENMQLKQHMEFPQKDRKKQKFGGEKLEQDFHTLKQDHALLMDKFDKLQQIFKDG